MGHPVYLLYQYYTKCRIQNVARSPSIKAFLHKVMGLEGSSGTIIEEQGSLIHADNNGTAAEWFSYNCMGQLIVRF